MFSSRKIPAVCFLFFLLSSALWAQQTSSAHLAWAPVDGARSYLVEVRRAGDAASTVIYSIRTEEFAVDLMLEPGNYEVRITAYNVLKKAFSVGDWSELAVIRTAEISSVTIISSELYAGSKEAELVLSGTGFIKATSVLLKQADKEFQGVCELDENSGSLNIRFDLTAAVSGRYQLILQNPGVEPVVAAKQIQVLDRVQPVVLAISRLELSNTRVYPDIRVTGQKFEKTIEFYLEYGNGRRIYASKIRLQGTTAAVVQFNLAEAPAGSCHLIAENPGGLKAELSTPVLIADVLGGETDPDHELLEIAGDAHSNSDSHSAVADSASVPDAAENDAVVMQSEDGGGVVSAGPTPIVDKTHSLYLELGYRPSFILPVGTFGTYFNHSWGGGELVLGVSFHNIFRPIPLLNLLGFELRVDPVYVPAVQPEAVASSYLMQYSTSTSLTFTALPFVDNTLGFTVRGGYGLVVSVLNRVTELSTENVVTQDSAFTAGLGVRWQPWLLVVEAGADWQGIFYVAQTAHLIRPYIRVGFWLN